MCVHAVISSTLVQYIRENIPGIRDSNTTSICKQLKNMMMGYFYYDYYVFYYDFYPIMMMGCFIGCLYLVAVIKRMRVKLIE